MAHGRIPESGLLLGIVHVEGEKGCLDDFLDMRTVKDALLDHAAELVSRNGLLDRLLAGIGDCFVGHQAFKQIHLLLALDSSCE